MNGSGGEKPETDGTAAFRPRSALLIAHDRSPETAQAILAAMRILEDAGIRLNRIPAPDAEHLPDAIRKAAPGLELVVLGGGDGTLSAAAPALLELGLPLGILPLGTANDLARSLGIPPDAEEAAHVIAAGHVRRIDVGEVNGRPFFNVASTGLSVAVTRELTRDMKRRWGRLAYAIAALRALPRARPFHAEIHCDGEVHHVKTLQVAIGNGRNYGGGMVVEEGAELDDGMLHLYSLEFERAWWLALMLPALRSGRQGAWKQVRTATCATVELRTRRPRRIDADGERAGRTPAIFGIRRAAIAVLAPLPAG